MGIGDSGASDFIHDSYFNPYLRNPVSADKVTYDTAGAGSIRGDLRGTLDVTVLNLVGE